YSAGSVPVMILISCTASVEGTHGERYRPRPTFTVLDTPSTETSPVAGGDPFAVNRTLVPVSVGRVSSRYRLPTTPGASIYRNRLLWPFSGCMSTVSRLITEPSDDDSA